MFEGDLIEGELEIGQIAGLLDKVETVAHVIEGVVSEFNESVKKSLSF